MPSPTFHHLARWLAVLALGVLATTTRATPIQYVFEQDTSISTPNTVVSGDLYVDSVTGAVVGTDGLQTPFSSIPVTYSELAASEPGPVWSSSGALQVTLAKNEAGYTLFLFGETAATNSDSQLFGTEFVNDETGAILAESYDYGYWTPQPQAPVPDSTPGIGIMAFALSCLWLINIQISRKPMSQREGKS